MKKISLILVFMFVLSLLVAVWPTTDPVDDFSKRILSDETTKEIWVGPHKLTAAIADDDQKRKQGLGDREFLADETGMLFIFDKPDFYAFWMRGMKFPLDFIWIRGDEISDITENVPVPEDSSHPATYRPAQTADKVLEVEAGWIEKHQVRVGNKVIIK